MKSSNLITLLALLLPLSGCVGRPDYTLSPPASTEWVTVTVRLPPQTEVTPMDVLYRSEKCQREDYDSTTESHIRKERGFNPRVVRMEKQGGDDIWQSRIALDGGGKCEWQLSALRFGIKLVSNNTLAAGKKIIETNYVVDFDKEGYSGGFDAGKVRDVNENIYIKTDLFPMVFINHILNQTTVKLFGGNADKKRWSRHYRVNNTKNIFIEPAVHMDKVVIMESPNPPPGSITATYPDGSKEEVSGIIPDYEKLLSMK